MIRTNVVKLSVVPAIAYRQKLPAGGSGVVVLCKGESQPGIASISKTSGEAIPAANTKKDFPMEAFKEAIELTNGMPYRKLGGVKYVEDEVVVDEVTPVVEEVTVDSKDYEAITAVYTDKNDKLSYDLINKDMIKFAHTSSVVRKMVAEKETVEKIRLYTVGTKFRNISNNHDMSDEQVLKIVELLDEVSPKGVLKEFNEEIRKSLKK